MKKSLNELSSLARIIENCFSGFKSTDLFNNHLNLQSPIYKNYNRESIGFPSDLKKPFGYKRILESFARSLGYNTYNGLVESGKLVHDLNENALEFLNPFPLNKFYTDIWKVLSSTIMRDLLNDHNVSETIFLGFKRSKTNTENLKNAFGLTPLIDGRYIYDESGRNCSDVNFVSRFKEFNHYYGVATSIFSYAMFISKDVESEYLIDKVPLREFVTFTEWDDSSFTLFKNQLIRIMSRLYKVELKISGRTSNPLDREVTIKFKSAYRNATTVQDSKENIELEKVKEETRLNNQLALKAIISEISTDKKYYRLNEEKKYFLSERYVIHYLTSINFETGGSDFEYTEFRNLLGDAESISKLGEQPKAREVFSGTKQYLLNLMPYHYSYEHEKYGTPASVEDIIEYWKNRVLPNMIPCN